jgi:N utilization substance protein A
VTFATHALSPAKVSRVSILDPIGKHMEVIVDDSQLSLAIGKKGQNVRLAAKLLGWKIDIKSEEEKRQEVESQMAALVAPGAPVSVLIEYGLSEKVAEQLVESGVATIERLGSMTPEQLEEIPGIGPESVEQLRDAVNAYYSQFETENAGPAQEAEPAASGEEPAEVDETGAPAPEVEPGLALEGEVAASTSEAPSEPEIPEEVLAVGPEPAEAAEESVEQFGTMEGAGSPTHNHPEGTGAPEQGRGE